MRRRLITGHSPYEGVAGFSRAVVVGDRVHVSGTAPIPADGSPPPDGAPGGFDDFAGNARQRPRTEPPTDPQEEPWQS